MNASPLLQIALLTVPAMQLVLRNDFEIPRYLLTNHESISLDMKLKIILSNVTEMKLNVLTRVHAMPTVHKVGAFLTKYLVKRPLSIRRVLFKGVSRVWTWSASRGLAINSKLMRITAPVCPNCKMFLVNAPLIATKVKQVKMVQSVT